MNENAPRYWIGVVSRQHVLRGVAGGFAPIGPGILSIGAADFARIGGGHGGRHGVTAPTGYFTVSLGKTPKNSPRFSQPR
jgi:hypothetical protein